jgi:mannitol/fructose-specific phosphotransferase system IIA component (Ntr-type)
MHRMNSRRPADLSPGARGRNQKHLEILSEIAELLSDAPLREKIKASTDAADLTA